MKSKDGSGAHVSGYPPEYLLDHSYVPGRRDERPAKPSIKPRPSGSKCDGVARSDAADRKSKGPSFRPKGDEMSSNREMGI